MGLTPPVAGDLLGPPIVIMKLADTSVNSDITVNDDPDLVFAIGPNENWAVVYNLFVTGNASGDIRIAIGTPTGCSGTFTSFGLVSTASTSGNLQTDGEILTGGTSGDHGTAAPGAGSVIGLMAWAGLVNGANAGNVQFKWAQISSNINNVTLMKGSFLTAYRIK